MSIAKRKVFYLSGFDPRGVHHYHALYKDAAARYAALHNEEIAVSARNRHQWTVTNRSAGVVTDYHFLGWDDIVRRYWIKSPWTLVTRSLAMYLAYARSFRWRTIFSLPRAPLVTLFYPLLALLFIAPVLTMLLAWLLPWPVALVVALAITPWVLNRIKALWLLRFFVFNYRAAREGDADLDARLDHFAECLHASFSESYDEILLVAHSNGSILAVPLLEKLFARTGALPEHFRLITLGHCIPLVRELDYATRFRTELLALAQRNFYWCDIGFPPDGAGYALIDPFAPYVPEHQVTLKLCSARFFRYYEPERYQAIRRSKYDLHFRYLMTGDRPSPLDYIKLTAGPQSLPESVAAYEAA